MQKSETQNHTIHILVIMVLAWFGVTLVASQPHDIAPVEAAGPQAAQTTPVPTEKPQVLTVMLDKIQKKTSWPEPARNTDYYPIPSWARTLRTENVDTALILAIAHQESRFRTDAISPRGAVGLMQLMPSTAEYMAGITLETSYASATGATPATRIGKHLKDPHTNILMGQKYLHYLQEQPYIGNNLVYLLAAYNAGPGAVAEWRKRSSKDPIRFINSIPYSETREYVKKVMNNYWMYQQLLGKKDNTLLQMIDGKMPTLRKV